MNVRELAALLAAYPDQDAIVEVLEHDDSGGGYYSQGGTVATVEFNPAEHLDYTDFRGNKFVKPDRNCYNKRYLFIGGRN